MPVIDRRGQPLRPDHPLKGNLIFFGVKPPKAYLERLKNNKTGTTDSGHNDSEHHQESVPDEKG